MPTPQTDRFTYPWHHLEDYLKDRRENELCLLAYGSLMNSLSAARTIDGSALSKLEPIVGIGIKRVFNYRMPESACSRHGQPRTPKHIAALNVQATENADDWVNGLLVRVASTDFDNLRKREINYNLVATPTYRWDSRGMLDETVFVLSCDDISDDILPHRKYLEICEVGARQISQSFHAAFLETTYLADGQRLSDWHELREA